MFASWDNFLGLLHMVMSTKVKSESLCMQIMDSEAAQILSSLIHSHFRAQRSSIILYYRVFAIKTLRFETPCI